MPSPRFVAVDIGASSGRVIAGTINSTSSDRHTIELETLHRFPNGVEHHDGHLRWNLERLGTEVRRGLARAPGAASVGISTWGVDYGLLDAGGDLIEEPIAYRDGRTAAVIERVHGAMSPADLYAIAGIQFLPFNTIYQLAAERDGPRHSRVDRALLIPDLLANQLTGSVGTEATNASTTGLIDARTRTWSVEIADRVGIDPDWFAPLEPPGTWRGATADGIPLISVASHDTASALVGVPATTDRFAYVVSGTWSLVGVELAAPVLTEAAREANFTNEAGVDGTVRFLRNVGGLWLLQECMRSWGTDDLDALLVAAAEVEDPGARIDVDDDAFIAPDDMPARIEAAAGRSLTVAETVRCILESLAVGYARTIDDAVALSGAVVDVVHVVGGGSQNALLCQLTANATGRVVLAGPVEATAYGNLLVQARTRDVLGGTLDEIRTGLAAAVQLRRFEPR